MTRKITIIAEDGENIFYECDLTEWSENIQITLPVQPQVGDWAVIDSKWRSGRSRTEETLSAYGLKIGNHIQDEAYEVIGK